MGLSLPEPGTCLQISGMGAMEWQSLTSKVYVCGRSGGTKTGDTGNLEIWLGSRDGGFREDGCCWVVTEMGQSDWERLVKDNF